MVLERKMAEIWASERQLAPFYVKGVTPKCVLFSDYFTILNIFVQNTYYCLFKLLRATSCEHNCEKFILLTLILREIWQYKCQKIQKGVWSWDRLWLSWVLSHNERDGISNHQPHHCLLMRLFRRRSKKTPKLRVTGLCGGIHRWPVNSPHKGPVTRKMFPFDDVIMDHFKTHSPFCRFFMVLVELWFHDWNV